MFMTKSSGRGLPRYNHVAMIYGKQTRKFLPREGKASVESSLVLGLKVAVATFPYGVDRNAWR
jgi:hypothetical protein